VKKLGGGNEAEEMKRSEMRQRLKLGDTLPMGYFFFFPF